MNSLIVADDREQTSGSHVVKKEHAKKKIKPAEENTFMKLV